MVWFACALACACVCVRGCVLVHACLSRNHKAYLKVYFSVIYMKRTERTKYIDTYLLAPATHHLLPAHSNNISDDAHLRGRRCCCNAKKQHFSAAPLRHCASLNAPSVLQLPRCASSCAPYKSLQERRCKSAAAQAASQKESLQERRQLLRKRRCKSAHRCKSVAAKASLQERRQLLQKRRCKSEHHCKSVASIHLIQRVAQSLPSVRQPLPALLSVHPYKLPLTQR